MAKPVIICVDDEPAVAAAIRRDVRARYQQDYRVLSATSGADALESLAELKSRDTQVALFLVDQRMPTMSGTEFLEKAIELYPDAKKVLLTAYADTDAAIASINTVGLDHYLMKPWEPPEQMLYPLLDDLLEQWQSTAPLSYEGIRVAGLLWSSRSHEVKDFLSRNRNRLRDNRRMNFQLANLDRKSPSERREVRQQAAKLKTALTKETWL